jgi:hypothetical protein
VCLLALTFPALAQAQSASVRIESTIGTLVPRATFTLPDNPVAPMGKQAQGTCPGNSVVGAVSAATGNDWSGAWTDGDGWSIDKIKAVDTTGSLSRKWVVLLNDSYLNDPPCTKLLNDGDSLTVFPFCIAQSTVSCFTGGPLFMDAPDQAGPGAYINVQVWETEVKLESGVGSAWRTSGANATLTSPFESVRTDQYYGTGAVRVNDKGPATLTASKFGYIGTRHGVCITDGADGYCGTTIPPVVPFDPYAYCTTTGNDGYCNSPDHVPPVGHITAPAQARSFSKGGGPTELKGTVDFDPSLTDRVNLRLVRQTIGTVTTYKKRKVWVSTKVHGKRVRKRVTKRVPIRKKQKICAYWSDSETDFKRMKKCTAPAGQFRAEGAEEWHYDFTSKLPNGSYMFDVLAVDGAGNTDSTMELGRNRVAFKVG